MNAKAQAVVMSIPPLTSDLPAINFAPWSRLASRRRGRSNNGQLGVDRLPRIRVFQISWTGIFLARPRVTTTANVVSK